MNSPFKAELLPIVIDGHSFAPNADGLWSLTEINKALPALTKLPAQWRGRDRDYFERCANLHTVHGDNGGTYATERAAIAYAMSCSLDFYVMVVDAFVAMRNNTVRENVVLKEDLAANLPKAMVTRARAAGHGMPWREVCKEVGISHPMLALEILLKHGFFVRPMNDLGDHEGSPRPAKQFFASGWCVKTTDMSGNREGWRAKTKFVDWIGPQAKAINAQVAEIQRNKAAKARKAKANKARKAPEAGHPPQPVEGPTRPR